jgi:hypothetical protein
LRRMVRVQIATVDRRCVGAITRRRVHGRK